MDEIDEKEIATQKDIPKLPIKTYRWEDVRRSRRKGAYPWTHLTKPPFNEEADPEEYTMDAFRRSRSTSTIGKSETQEVSEVEEDIDMKEEERHKERNGLPEDKEIINSKQTEEPSTSEEAIKTAQLKPLTSVKENRSKSEEPKRKRKLSLESSHSRISFSKQALIDKFKEAKNKIKVPKIPKRSKSDASDLKQPKKQKTTKATAKEERSRAPWMPPPSNESPVYIHIPLKPPPGETDEFSRLEFESPSHSRSGSLTNLPQIGQGKRKMSLLGLLTEIKKAHDQQILTSEARRASQSSETPLRQTVKKHGVESDKGSKSDLGESTDSVSSEPKKLGIGKPRIQRKESDRLIIEEILDDDKRSNRSTEDSKPESERTHKPKTPEPIVVEPEDSSAEDNISQYLDKDDKCEIVSEKSTEASSENVNQAGPSKVETIKESKPSQSPILTKPDPQKAKKLEATLSKWKKTLPVAAGQTQQSPLVKQVLSQRAKSEEPKRKRRSSIDSSYSRKSLSKLAFMKRLKEAKDKIKLPKFPSFSKADKKSKEKKSEDKKTDDTSKKDKTLAVKKDQTKQETPVYIRIPLKLPPGQTDEFSHLADESEVKVKEPEKPKEKEKKEEESSVPTSPETPPHDVQLIFLTPPSDDEILDSSPIPETPSETGKKFFDNLKIEELKTLAKNAVETIYPDHQKLETVKEDEGSDEQEEAEAQQQEDKIKEDLSDENKAILQNQQQMLVDEEDGLKLSEAAIAMINEELAKELKKQEESKSSKKSDGSPAIKKKVSFKRKSRAEDGERIYEDVELNKEAGKIGSSEEKKETPQKTDRLESFQSMPVDEEKTYLDKKVIKDTSLEDDYNKWSKLSDHEYEPVNPPPEEMTSKGPPQVRTADINHTVGKNIDGSASPERHFVRIPPDEELVIHGDDMGEENLDESQAQEMQRRIEDRFFNTTPETVSSRTDGELHTSQADSSTLETLPLKRENRKKTKPKTESTVKTFNETLRSQADKIKTKFQSLKKPNISLPERPKFSSTKLKKPNFKKPTFKMPKMPDKPSINLPSFNFARKDSSKDSWRERQFSTESNAGDSKKKIFDFKTYPRIFDRAKKGSSPPKDRAPTPPPPEFATVPRANRKKGPVGSRWATKFKDITYADEDTRKSKESDNDTQDVIRIPLHPDNDVPMDVPSHTRYNEDIDIDDDFDRENRDIHRASPFSKDFLKRWSHGEFHEGPPQHELQYPEDINRGGYRITDLDNDAEDIQTPPDGSFDTGMPHPKDEHSSGSLSEHRQGVLEEIDSDEFFLREKGISQENIEVGKYLSSEIREAFRNPVNALSQLQSEDREYDLDVSDQSEPLQSVPRKKPSKKTRRKKTPHSSKEQISYDRESITTEPEEYPKPFDNFQRFAPPARPKRRSKKGKKKKQMADEIIPYQETIPIEEQFRSITPTDYPLDTMEGSEILPDNILGDHQQEFYDKDLPQMYENEHMRGIEQPEIKVSDPYYRYENFPQGIERFLKDQPAPTAPIRRRKSLKSLEVSEPDSIIEEIQPQNIDVYRAEHEYIIPTPEPPSRPKRTRSRTRSQSRTSQQEDDRTSRGAESLISDNQIEVIEEPCVQDIRDASGYAVIDKTKVREPPLPPSRFPTTPPRTRRSKRNGAKSENKFATTPRSISGTPPSRPLRNYSTLGGPSQTSRSITPNDEEKENIDISQYSEIDGEPVKHLQSGEVIQKMKARPLPAPPRPPRRPRAPLREVFRDISHERNIPQETKVDFDKTLTREIEISTQMGQPSDKADVTDDTILADIEDQILPYDHEETITHGTLVVQPIDNARILPYSQLHGSNQKPTTQPPVEQIIPVTREYPIDIRSSKQDQETYDDEETSEIPEDFKKLKSPPTSPTETKLQQPLAQESQEVGVLKAKKLQVLDLDVDKLRVNELQASKIIVSELDGVSLQVSEINSRSGNLVLSGIELPPHLIQEMLERLQSAAHEQLPSVTDQSLSPQSSEATTQTAKPESTSEHTENVPTQPESTEQPDKSAKLGQKKTPIEEESLEVSNFEEAPPVPPRYDSKTDLLEDNIEQSMELESEHQKPPQQECPEEILQPNLEETVDINLQEPPVRPPRKSLQTEKIIENVQEPDISEPPMYSNIQSEGTDSSKMPETSEEHQTQESPESEQIQPKLLDSIFQADNTSRSDEEPPPRPPQPVLQQDSDYIPSQPPASFFALRSPQFGEFIEEDIPLPPRRKRHHKAPPVSRSSSEDVAPTPRRHHRSPEPSIPQLTGQLVRACATETNRSLKRLISHITNNVLRNTDGKQDLHVMILMMLILIAGLILLGGDETVTIHHHHWEFFNPPRDL